MCQPGRPGPHGRRPTRLARLGRFPEGEIERVFLALVDLDARAGEQVVEIAMAKACRSPGTTRTPEVDVAVDVVGVALGDQPFDHLDDRANLLRRARIAWSPARR